MNKVGYIYSLTCSNPNLIYYGSTTRPLNVRFSGHKRDFKNNKQVSSKILFEWGNVKINLLEEIQYENKKELLDRESYYIRNLKCVNKEIPGRTNKEWRTDNKDKVKLYNEKWRNNNGNIINKKNKEYREKNKEKLKEIKKKYRDENKDKIKEYTKIKITCDCGSELRKADILRHKKTQKHKVYEFLKEIEDSNIKL